MSRTVSNPGAQAEQLGPVCATQHARKSLPFGTAVGNTTSAAAMLAALTDASPSDCCGRGTGLDDAGVAGKIEIVTRALERHADAMSCAVAPERARRVLAALGGLEIAAMVGAYLEASERGCVAVVDGFISSIAALCAASIEPSCRDAMVLATVSGERGGVRVAAALGRERPALDMGLRLGEGSGAALALPLLRAAADLVTKMATLDEAMQL